MLGPQNAQDFIRALKASSDPPHVGGPSKIDIAREAWENNHLYVPNKAEAIVEWLLTRLLKDRARDRYDFLAPLPEHVLNYALDSQTLSAISATGISSRRYSHPRSMAITAALCEHGLYRY